MRQQVVMTDELFCQLAKDDKLINTIAKPVECYDKYHKFSHYKTCTYPVEYVVTKQQISIAKELYDIRKKETLTSIKKGELVFRAMGCDFNSNYGNGIGNYRIRCYFKNSFGHKYFIELSCFHEDEISFHVDFSIDEVLREKRERERMEELEKRRIAKGHWFVNEIQDYSNCFAVENKYKDIPFTFDNVVRFVNEIYGCSYRSARLIEYFATCEEWCCEC